MCLNPTSQTIPGPDPDSTHKWKCREMNKSNQYFLYMSRWFFNFFAALFSRKWKISLNLLLWKHLLIFKILPVTLFKELVAAFRNACYCKTCSVTRMLLWKSKLFRKPPMTCTVGAESLCRVESLCRNTCISYFRHLELRQEPNFFTAYIMCLRIGRKFKKSLIKILNMKKEC